jgi:hypothetical protein
LKTLLPLCSLFLLTLHCHWLFNTPSKHESTSFRSVHRQAVYHEHSAGMSTCYYCENKKWLTFQGSRQPYAQPPLGTTGSYQPVASSYPAEPTIFAPIPQSTQYGYAAPIGPGKKEDPQDAINQIVQEDANRIPSSAQTSTSPGTSLAPLTDAERIKRQRELRTVREPTRDESDAEALVSNCCHQYKINYS